MIMKQTIAIVLTLALLSASALAGPPLPMAGIVREARVGASDFRLFDGTHTADVVVDGADSKTVKLAAGLFCDDIGRIGGTKARLVEDIGTAAADCVIVGSMKESGLIKKLASEGRIDLREIEGQWEACVVATVDKPFAGIERALVIAGSDRRGTAYGLFEISNQMGVSPWYFFADVAPKRKAERLHRGGTPPPAAAIGQIPRDFHQRRAVGHQAVGLAYFRPRGRQGPGTENQCENI